MAAIEDLLRDIDKLWSLTGQEPAALRIIGSAALMLQFDYVRGTKDGDILESSPESSAITEQLTKLAGKDTTLHAKHGMYIDIVKRALLFLPTQEVFHQLPRINLKQFKVEVLDVNDVVLSKLARFHSDDINDIREMAKQDLIDHAVLVERFRKAASWFEMDARCGELPRYLKNLHRVERDILGMAESMIELPGGGEDD